jgi:hypothetical protein
MIRVLTICGYLACIAAAVVIELLARRDPDRVAPLGDLMDQVMATRSARIGILLFWWWAGWHFLVGQTV